MAHNADYVLCGFCGFEPIYHGDSDAGPMTVCPHPHDMDVGGHWTPGRAAWHAAHIDGSGADTR